MSTRIPSNPRKEIFAHVYAKADEHLYLEKSRPENAQFMENLRRDPKVGGRLENYMDPTKVKTYIKDTILNKYAKDRKVLPRSVEELLYPIYGELVEIDYRKQDHVSLHRMENHSRRVAVSRASDLKWETGLRKLIQYVAAMPLASSISSLFPVSTDNPELVLIIFEYGGPMNDSDKHLIEKGLALINVKCLWG